MKRIFNQKLGLLLALCAMMPLWGMEEQPDTDSSESDYSSEAESLIETPAPRKSAFFRGPGSVTSSEASSPQKTPSKRTASEMSSEAPQSPRAAHVPAGKTPQTPDKYNPTGLTPYMKRTRIAETFAQERPGAQTAIFFGTDSSDEDTSDNEQERAAIRARQQRLLKKYQEHVPQQASATDTFIQHAADYLFEDSREIKHAADNVLAATKADPATRNQFLNDLSRAIAELKLSENNDENNQKLKNLSSFHNIDSYGNHFKKLLSELYTLTPAKNKALFAQLPVPLIHNEHLYQADGSGYHYEGERPATPSRQFLSPVRPHSPYGAFWKRGGKKGEKFSSFFPRELDKDAITRLVKEAFEHPIAHVKNEQYPSKSTLLGTTNNGMIIEMNVDEDGIGVQPYPIIAYIDLVENPKAITDLDDHTFAADKLIDMANKAVTAGSPKKEGSWHPLRYVLGTENSGSFIIDIGKQIATEIDPELSQEQQNQTRGILVRVPQDKIRARSPQFEEQARRRGSKTTPPLEKPTARKLFPKN